VTLLTDHRGALDRLAAQLIEHETVDGKAALKTQQDEDMFASAR